MPRSDFKPHTGRHLSFAEREEIAVCRAYGYGVHEIAKRLDPPALPWPTPPSVPWSRADGQPVT